MMRAAKALLLAGLACATTAAGMGYGIPSDEPTRLLPGPNADLAAGACAACHSLDYITTQPRGKGAQFWKDSVTKMIKVYGAAIDPEDADRIAAYLGKTYGSAVLSDERTKAVPHPN